MRVIGKFDIIWNRVQIEKETKENERSPSVAFLFAGL